MKRFVFSISCIFLFLISMPAASVQLQSLETEFLLLVYFEESYYIIAHLARSFENSMKFHRELFDYTPSEKVLILLHDFGDIGHGGTITMPWNYITLGIEPFEQVYETAPSNERMNWLMHHELVHVVATDKSSPNDEFYRTIFFGKVLPIADYPLSMFYSYLTSPRWYCPRWYHEGIAVFLETWMSGGLGRALGGYDEMVFRTMVRDSSYFYDIVGLESEGTTIDFQVGQNSYLYGTRFVSYLAYHYGPEKLLEWFDRTGESKRYFTSQFKKVYGRSLDDEWVAWVEWEHQWQRTNLDSIHANPVTQYRPLSERALGSVSRSFYDPVTRKLYAATLYPGQLANISSIDIDTGRIEKICNVPGPALYYVSSLAYDPDTRNIFFTTDNVFRWRDIRVVDLQTGTSKRLIKDCRTGDLAFNRADKSLWGVQHHNGRSIVVRIPSPYETWEDIFVLPYGKNIFDLDISPDGKYLTASIIEVTGRQRLIRMNIENLLSKDTSYDVLYEFEENAPQNFVFTDDGRYLLGTSYYTGVSNVWRYDFETEHMDILTNCETGFFRPVPLPGDSLIVFRYTGKGFLPVMISAQPLEDVSAIRYLGQAVVDRHPIVTEWMAGSPASINIDSLTTFSGPYSPFRNIKLASVYPVVEGYRDTYVDGHSDYVALGIRMNFADPIRMNDFNLTASYSPYSKLPGDERFHTTFNYSKWPWDISASYNGADFYDLFGPTKKSRKGYSLSLNYQSYLIYEKPKMLDYSFNVAGYGGLERLPDFQNVAVSYDKFVTLRANLNYSNKRTTLGGVDSEKGVTGQINSFNTYVNEKFYPHVNANLDYGFLLPIEHMALWLRSSFGYAHGDRDEPFANFYFGGFGNNWVDYLSIKRYREYYSFPGVELNAIGGTNYAKMMLEWTFPPLRFRRFGFPVLYCNWARMAVFTSGIKTNVDPDDLFELTSKDYRRSVMNAGGQIDMQLVIFSNLPSTLSLGYALAFEKHHSIEKEFMISLKILR
ncbi:MAG: hypothetical protein JSV84_07515 [Gemmatimonadota bacterium]|nr:MAG: hypothetical protein JSV84_07515 [Gemmatimonadota bacterium]